jgi:hypothetical protein
MHAPDLERQLRDLGPALDWPAAPNLAPAVRARIAEAHRRPFPWRRTVVIALAVAVVAVGAAMAVPGARTAILDWLGIRGVAIHRVETLPPTPTYADDLGVGEPVTLAEARERVTFPVPDPSSVGLGEPDEIRFDPGSNQVAFIWRDSDGQIETLLTVFRASWEKEFIDKWVGAGVPIEPVDVPGAGRGVWIGGSLAERPHAFVYRDRRGEFREETFRLAGSALIWQDGDLTWRLEGDRTRAKALEIAESVARTSESPR